MRILLASFWALPFAGGIWTYVKQIKSAWEQAGHEVEILAKHPDERSFYLVRQGDKLLRRSLRPRISRRVDRFYEEREISLEPVVRRFEIDRYSMETAALHFGIEHYDLLHAQDVISARALQRVKSAHTPLITTIHGALPKEFQLHGKIEDPSGPLWHYLLAQDFLGATAGDMTITPSRWLHTFYTEEVGVPNERLTVIPYGLDLAEFARQTESAPSATAPSDKKVLICPARFDRVKGHTDLLDALARLRERNSDFVCWLVGDGYLRSELEQRCEELNLREHVQFLGVRQDVPALLKQADIFVLPSLQDNLPFAVMEAQLAGKTVVTTDAGGLKEMIEHGKTGLLSPAGRSDLLFENLAQALTDETLSASLSRYAEEWGREKWALNRMVERTEEVYHQALHKFQKEGGKT